MKNRTFFGVNPFLFTFIYKKREKVCLKHSLHAKFKKKNHVRQENGVLPIKCGKQPGCY